MSESEGDKQRARLLLIEDDADTLRVLSRLLTRLGYSVCTADTVATALKAAEDHPVDVIVSTYELPDGDGLQVMRELAGRGTRGVIMTSYFDREEQSRAAGFGAYLLKPVRMEDLSRAIEQLTA